MSDIKKDIGYGGKAAYRRWRNVNFSNNLSF